MQATHTASTLFDAQLRCVHMHAFIHLSFRVFVCVWLSAIWKYDSRCKTVAFPWEPGRVVLPQASPLAQCWVKTSPVVRGKKNNSGAAESASLSTANRSNVLHDNDTDIAPTVLSQPFTGVKSLCILGKGIIDPNDVSVILQTFLSGATCALQYTNTKFSHTQRL